MYERGLRQQRHAQKRSSSDSDGAPRVTPRFLHVLGALVGLGAEFGGACGSRRSPRGGLWSGPAGAGADAAATLPLLRSLLQLVGRAPALPAAAVGSDAAQLRLGAAQKASWGL